MQQIFKMGLFISTLLMHKIFCRIHIPSVQTALDHKVQADPQNTIRTANTYIVCDNSIRTQNQERRGKQAKDVGNLLVNELIAISFQIAQL